jgi:hypothetical protein
LSLGVKTMTAEEAFGVLAGIGSEGKRASDGGVADEGGIAGKGDGTDDGGLAGKGGPDRQAWRSAMEAFMRRERDALINLRRILTGEDAAGTARLEALLDECDYLWAHFPDCAGAEGKRPPGTDISFLKRVRVEIDPFIRLWDLALLDSYLLRPF